MTRKARRLILLGLVAIVITVSIWSLQFTVQTPEKILGSTESLDLGLNEEQVPETLCYIVIENWPRSSTPEKYVDLTEEEVARFPILQAALQILRGSNQTKVMYETSEGEAHRIFHYLTTKTQDKYNCTTCGGNRFKYQGEFFHFYIVIPEVGETISKVSTAPRVVFLLCVIFVILYAHGTEKRK